MKYAIVAVAQQALRLYSDVESYKRDLERFFRLAEGKHARLLIFPERTALMLVPPLVEGFRAGLLKKAGTPRDPARSWWERTRSSVMRGTAKLLGADLRREVRKTLEEMPEFVWQRYVDIFAHLAYEYKVTVVAGSGFFKGPNSSSLHHMVTVFGPDGDILGHHAKVLLDEEEQEWVEPGEGWHVVETPVGRLGLVLGEEVMYPEVGRVLAYQGMDALIALAAVRDPLRGQILREGLQARVVDNQVYGALAFTVGHDPLADAEKAPYRGRSVIMAPQGLTSRRDSIVVESGSATAEVLLTARWDMEALHRYWETAPIPVRRRLPARAAGSLLAALYSQHVTLEEAMQALPTARPRALPESPAEETPESATSAEAPEDISPEPPAEPAPPVEPPAEEEPSAPPAVEEEVRAEESSPEAEVLPESEAEETPVEEAAEALVEAVTSEPEPEAPHPAGSEEVVELTPDEVDVSPPEGPEGKGERGLEVSLPPSPPTTTVQEAVEDIAEEEPFPSHLWEMVKRELEEAAKVLRTLTQEEIEEDLAEVEETSPTRSAEKGEKTSAAGLTAETEEGWFRRLVEQGKERGEEEVDW